MTLVNAVRQQSQAASRVLSFGEAKGREASRKPAIASGPRRAGDSPPIRRRGRPRSGWSGRRSAGAANRPAPIRCRRCRPARRGFGARRETSRAGRSSLTSGLSTPARVSPQTLAGCWNLQPWTSFDSAAPSSLAVPLLVLLRSRPTRIVAHWFQPRAEGPVGTLTPCGSRANLRKLGDSVIPSFRACLHYARATRKALPRVITMKMGTVAPLFRRGGFQTRLRPCPGTPPCFHPFMWPPKGHSDSEAQPRNPRRCPPGTLAPPRLWQAFASQLV